jgi:hypothetical protein
MTTTEAPGQTNRVKTHLDQKYLDAVDSGGPLATFLGVFSIGLGLWELLSPRTVGVVTGVRYPGLVRAYGAREIAAGVGILGSERPAKWLWARVAGDAADLATIAAACVGASGRDRTKAAVAAAAVAGVTALDIACAMQHSRGSNG